MAENDKHADTVAQLAFFSELAHNGFHGAFLDTDIARAKAQCEDARVYEELLKETPLRIGGYITETTKGHVPHIYGQRKRRQ